MSNRVDGWTVTQQPAVGNVITNDRSLLGVNEGESTRT